MQPALHQDLVAAQRDGLADLLEQHLAVEDVGLGVVDLAVERAEVADRRADVGVVDVAVDVVGAIRLGMEPAADRVGGAAQLQQRGRTEQLDPLVETQALAVNGAVQDRGDGGRQGSLLPVPVRAAPPCRRTASARRSRAPRGRRTRPWSGNRNTS